MKIQKITSTTSGSTFFLLFISCYFFSSIAVVVAKIGLEQDYINFIRYTFLIVSLIIMAFSTFLLSFKEKVVIAITFASCSLTILLSHSTWSIVLINSLYLAIYCKRLDLISIAKAIMVGNLCILIITLPLLIFSDSWGSFDPRYGIRATYGFTSPNIVAMYLFSFYSGLMLYLYAVVKSKAIALFFLTLFLVVFTLLINDTVSRTSLFFLYLSYSVFLLSLLFSWKNSWKILTYVCILLIVFIFIFQIYTSFNYNSDMGVINLALSNRIGLSSFLYQGVGVPKFIYGIDIEPYSPIDFFFIAYVYSLGVGLSLFLLLIFIKRLSNIKFNLALFAICIGGLLSTLTERQFLIPLCSIMLYIVYSKSLNKDN
ncbi:hypothetical protein [Klebsiella quasipneumoniae]|uniref:hypothetical protein n=1 Tax=Klebsiella quasipneumoniae TaxID=1463165 RepID=UPI00115A8041|nr:hypothetical protein [Klebsiella quasipneumoniae]BBS48386.1 hypothetical protein WP5S18E05_35970 [Klebsiella quasipneumoniae]HDZ9165125.1 hypothetical protein [Klebsiella quasipneumoniae subsp. quasipneumoniae]